MLDEALVSARAELGRSPGAAYLRGRGLRDHTFSLYGLGFGLPVPAVSQKTIKFARQSRLVGYSGVWLWAGGVVYTDPPDKPSVLNVRYLDAEQLTPGTRDFTPNGKHKTWGRRTQPLGVWRMKTTTEWVFVVEGIFDMFVFAQSFRDRNLEHHVMAACTNGASPAKPVLDWFKTNPYKYVLVPDSDQAGRLWTQKLTATIRQGGGSIWVANTLGNLDPDEAVLQGWWPKSHN